ncbi:hypothetical protein BS47DRAFT_1360849 [Hydnum rufescens UP504]|uniref:Uncharacterized protein n=1 Tax=Hydnum rufescens UP504 TaxID=1448309 RepID=A0A9P6B219_9AGAM|nr:hypothetical protein BS47DRAFT_1360849 [Hydnum rufescens UP504]
MTTHPLRRPKPKTNDRPPNEWPQEPHPLQRVWSYLRAQWKYAKPRETKRNEAKRNDAQPHAKPNETTPHPTKQRQAKTREVATRTTHPLRRVCGSIQCITTNEDPWSEPPPRDQTPAKRDPLSPEPPAKRTPSPGNDNATRQGTPPRRNPGPRTHDAGPQGPQTNHTRFGGWSSKMTTRRTNPPNSPLGMMMRPAKTTRAKRNTPTTTGQTKPKRVPHTRFGGCVVILSNESKPQRKPRTNPTPASAGILLNPHPPTEATTPPSENTRPWVRGNPNGEARNNVPGTTHLPKRYHTPARVDIIPDKPVWPAASLRFSKSQFRPIFGHFGQFWFRR